MTDQDLSFDLTLLPTEVVPISQLRPHPRNYRKHPPDQIEHIAQSIREHGVYRNVVVANDYTILGGHGVVLAATALGLSELEVKVTAHDPDDPMALKILTGDNELGLLAEVDDRLLSELLKEIVDLDDLLGTGYDEQMLASLLFVTRPSHEIEGMDEAAAWVGMPEFESWGHDLTLVVRFDTEDDRNKLVEQLGVRGNSLSGKDGKRTWSCWFPPRKQDDVASIRFTTEEAEAEAAAVEAEAEAEA